MHDLSSLLNAKCGIILSADLTELRSLQELIELGSHVDEVVAIKVGFTLALRYGLSTLVKTIKSIKNFPVIYDHQKAGTDIPQMGDAFSETCSESGIDGVIFFPQAGPKVLESFVQGAFDYGLTPIVGLVMTHQAYLLSEGGFIDDNSPDKICKISINIGVKHFVLPGTKTDIIRKFCQENLKQIRPSNVMMPGIGSQGGSISKAFEATIGHYPFAIIGSAIYKASNPKDALEAFAAKVRVWTKK